MSLSFKGTGAAGGNSLSMLKQGVSYVGASVTRDGHGNIVCAVNTYISGETREARLAYADGAVSKIEVRDSLLQVVTVSEFGNGLPEPTACSSPAFDTFEFSIETT